MAKRVKLADVAKLTGLSQSTVSTILNHRASPRYPEETIQRVMSAAAELGYAPDPTARSLRTGRTGAIGFISDEVTVTRYASAMIRGILDVAQARQHVVMMSECDHQPDQLEQAIDVLKSRRTDGLLFGLMRARLIDLPVAGHGMPTVIINGTAAGTRGVLPDEVQAGRAAVEHLVSKGHRRIAFIGRSPIHLDPRISVTIGRRITGIDDAMRDCGLTFVAEHGGHDWEPELGFAGAMHVLDCAPALTAILVANDRVALGVYQAAQARGLRIPEDMSVMSFDDEQLATYLRPQVTTMRLPYREMGSQAMQLLLDGLAAGSSSEPESLEHLVPMPLIERGSVAGA